MLIETPQLSLSKKNSVLDQNLSLLSKRPKAVTLILQIPAGIQKTKHHPDTLTF